MGDNLQDQWVMVPRVATPEMVEAGRHHDDLADRSNVRRIYHAMLAAAPRQAPAAPSIGTVGPALSGESVSPALIAPSPDVEHDLPWRDISECPHSDDLFWFRRGDTIDGPREPEFHDSDYWDWFAPCEAPPTAALRQPVQAAPEAVAWQRRIRGDSQKWLAWEEYTGEGFPETVGRFTCEYRALYTAPHATPADNAALHAAYEAGWRVAAEWAGRDDLISDIPSPAYEHDRAKALKAALMPIPPCWLKHEEPQ